MLLNIEVLDPATGNIESVEGIIIQGPEVEHIVDHLHASGLVVTERGYVWE